MRHLGIACLAVLLAVPGVVRAQLAPIDQPFSITSTPGSHTAPRLAARPDGTWLAVWTTDPGSGRTLSGRFFGPGGAPLAPPFGIATGQIGASAVALLPDGGFVAVWEQGHQILGSLHDRDGRVRVPAFLVAAGFDAAPAVAADAGGEWMVVWEEQEGGDLDIFGRWFGLDGTPRTAPLQLSRITRSITQFEPGVTALPGGGFLAAWNELNRAFPGDDTLLVARRFPAPGVASGPEEALLEGGVPGFLPLPDGQGLLLESRPFGNPELVRLDAAGTPAGPSVRLPDQDFFVTGTLVLDTAGRLLAVGTGPGQRVLGQLYDTTSFEPLDDPFAIPTAMPASSRPVLAAAPSGSILMVWEEAGRLFGEVLAQGCAAPDLGLCLAEDRFRVEVSWRDAQGAMQKAHPVPLRDDTGSFWFFAPSNPELLIKVLDGRSLNGHFWVFFGSLSDVPYEIRVVDTVTGASRLYTNPAGTLASRADVRAFPAAAALPAPERHRGAPAAPVAEASDCRSSDAALCLTSGYRVTVDFVEPGTGASRQARAVPFSNESGAFWFFDEANLELFVKVLDGTAVNGHVWVFHGALTDVEHTITVKAPDGAEWTYHNPRGRMHSGADTSALPAP